MLGGLVQQLFHTGAGGVQVRGDAGQRIAGSRVAGAGALGALHRLGEPLAGITQLVEARPAGAGRCRALAQAGLGEHPRAQDGARLFHKA